MLKLNLTLVLLVLYSAIFLFGSDYKFVLQDSIILSQPVNPNAKTGDLFGTGNDCLIEYQPGIIEIYDFIDSSDLLIKQLRIDNIGYYRSADLNGNGKDEIITHSQGILTSYEYNGVDFDSTGYLCPGIIKGLLIGNLDNDPEAER